MTTTTYLKRERNTGLIKINKLLKNYGQGMVAVGVLFLVSLKLQNARETLQKAQPKWRNNATRRQVHTKMGWVSI
jgi:hypothetical protein